MLKMLELHATMEQLVRLMINNNTIRAVLFLFLHLVLYIDGNERKN